MTPELNGMLAAIPRLRKQLRQGSNRQVRSLSEREPLQEFAFWWFRTKKSIAGASPETLAELDEEFRRLLDGAERNTSRKTHLERLDSLKRLLMDARAQSLFVKPGDTEQDSGSAPPDFSSLVHDPAMQGVLTRRWLEVQACIKAEAHLAATVMMGGLLEGLLLTRMLRTGDRAPLFKAKSAPKDSRTKKVKPLQDWMLADFLEVAHEVGWITKSARDVGKVVRDYRNYVHPQKELSHAITLEDLDTRLLWAVFVEVSHQLLNPGSGGNQAG